MACTQVNSVQQLKEILSDGKQHEFAILLNHGIRSSKSIYLMDENTMDIFHHISDTWEKLSFKELLEDTDNMIGIAINSGAFYWEWSEESKKGTTKCK